MATSRGTSVRVVLTTASSVVEAERIGRTLVDERLVACATVVPGVTSIYRWQGEIEQEGEVLIVLKTTHEVVEQLTRRVVELHSYDVPEVLALTVDDGSERYLEWVEGEVRA